MRDRPTVPEALLRDARRATWILIVPAQTFLEQRGETAAHRRGTPRVPLRLEESESDDPTPLEDQLATAILVLWAVVLLGGLCYLAYAF
jgi:hypothetical protein